MQSILLTTPSKASKIEANHDNKLSDGATSIKGKVQEKESGTRFASVFENTVSERTASESKGTKGKVQDKSVESKNKATDGELSSEVSSTKETSIKAGASSKDALPTEASIKSSKDILITEASIKAGASSKDILPTEASIKAGASSKDSLPTEASIKTGASSKDVLPTEISIKEGESSKAGASSKDVLPTEAPIKAGASSKDVLATEASIKEGESSKKTLSTKEALVSKVTSSTNEIVTAEEIPSNNSIILNKEKSDKSSQTTSSLEKNLLTKSSSEALEIENSGIILDSKSPKNKTTESLIINPDSESSDLHNSDQTQATIQKKQAVTADLESSFISTNNEELSLEKVRFEADTFSNEKNQVVTKINDSSSGISNEVSLSEETLETDAILTKSSSPTLKNKSETIVNMSTKEDIPEELTEKDSFQNSSNNAEKISVSDSLTVKNTFNDATTNIVDANEATTEEQEIQKFNPNEFTKQNADTILSKEINVSKQSATGVDKVSETVSPEMAQEIAQKVDILNSINLSAETSKGDSQQLAQTKNIESDINVFNNNHVQEGEVIAEDKVSEEALQADMLSMVMPNLSPVANEVKVAIKGSDYKEIDSEKFADEMVNIDSTQESDLETIAQQINPILAQIESAQKTDTKVSNNQFQITGTAGIVSEKSEKDKTSSKDATKDANKVGKANFENVLADTSEESATIGKELINKANLASNEKLEGMLASFRAETNKSVFNQNTENSSVNTLGAMSAGVDKLLHQTQSSVVNQTLQSSALQQPLELQAKHASAMVGERILMMLNQGKQEVTIRLDPAELGSMHIKLHVQQDQLQVAIQTQVGQSRDIIEQNLPRLREQLAQQGINLGEASVEQQSKQNQSNSQGSSQMGSSSQGSDNRGESFNEEQSDFFPTKIPLPAQGIDYYA